MERGARTPPLPFFFIIIKLLKPLKIIRITPLYSNRYGHLVINPELYLLEKKDNSKKVDANALKVDVDALQKKITKSKIPDENVEVESINIEDREKKVKTKNDKNTDSLFDDI